MSVKKWTKRFLWLALGLGLVIGSYAGYMSATGNVHRLPNGQVYRSGQLGAKSLEDLAQSHGLRSVLNLLGPEPRESWYIAETNVCAAFGLQHADFKLSARRQLTESDVDHLVQVIRALPKPLLIHCRGGADRTSLACALYRYDVVGEPAEVAASELSVFYGHLPYLQWHESIAMDRTFWSHTTNHVRGDSGSGT
jgi:protein tyrosine/serine phosphatase